MDVSREFRLMLDAAIHDNLLDFTGFDSSKNVQDQLQEMVSYPSVPVMMAAFTRFTQGTYKSLPTCGEQGCYDGCHVVANWQAFTSMEQLWLAFVMKEKGKAWNGEDWVASMP